MGGGEGVGLGMDAVAGPAVEAAAPVAPAPAAVPPPRNAARASGVNATIANCCARRHSATPPNKPARAPSHHRDLPRRARLIAIATSPSARTSMTVAAIPTTVVRGDRP